MKYEILFSPIKIGKQEVKNRIAMAPMGTSLQGLKGEVTTEMVDFYEARAKGGTGLIISSFTAVDDRYRTLTIGLHSRELIPGISCLAEAVKFYGTKFVLQLSHFGGKAPSFLTGKQPIAPSSIESIMYPEVPKEMTIEEIEEAIELFIQSAIMARDAGCDGVELHGAHTYLIGQFVSPYCNRRNDKYGGDFERRMNFVSKILAGVRKNCGDDFIIGYKFSAYEHLDGGIKKELAKEIAKYMEKKGVDYIHTSAYSSTLFGIVDTDFQSVPGMYYPRGSLVPLAENVKNSIKNVPVMAAGGIADPEFAEEILQNEKADIVTLGRALIADPEWPNKAKNDGIIRQCIRCQVCYKRVITQQWVKCTINPITCDEHRYGKYITEKALVPKKVIIIGAGPAGMEAAIRAKQRGHEVVLFEAKNEIGGNLVPASVPDFKIEVRKLLETYKKEIDLYNIEVKLNKAVNDLKDIEDEKADAVIIATGSKLITPSIEGIENDNVCTVLEYYENKELNLGKDILIVGAGDVGCELALHLALKNKNVTVVDIISEDEMLSDEVTPWRTGLMLKVKKAGVEIFNEASVEKIEENSAVIRDKKGIKKVLYIDNVISATGFACNINLINKLKDSFSGKFLEVYTIGDCINPGRLYEAIHSGAKLAWQI